ncbi:HNH endonuclease [Variovorax soli]|nr:HNH endonuclease signature motif containing protein [Variovorax soli]
MLRSNLPTLDHENVGGVQSKRLRGGNLTALRRRMLAASGQRCQCEECQASGLPMALTMATMELDHRVPLALGGGHELSNLRAVHVTCHRRITAEQAPILQGRTWADAVDMPLSKPSDFDVCG